MYERGDSYGQVRGNVNLFFVAPAKSAATLNLALTGIHILNDTSNATDRAFAIISKLLKILK